MRPRRASGAVAYRRLGNSIIYLEKGPLGMFIEGFVPTTSSSTATPPAPTHAVRISEQVIDGAVAPATSEPALDKGTTLYIKNLAFSTTQERLHKVFAHLPGFSYARVQAKPDPKRPDARLSMGYGFMGFADVAGANAALKSVQGFVLDGHALHVSFAGRGADEPEKKKGVDVASRTTKMIVKNVPFEATRKDIRDLFGCVFSVSAMIIAHIMYSAVPMAISSPSVCPKSSTRARAALLSSSLSLATKPRTRTQRCVTHICLAGISYLNGQRRLSRTSMCSARKQVSGTRTGQKICLGKNASLISEKIQKTMSKTSRSDRSDLASWRKVLAVMWCFFFFPYSFISSLYYHDLRPQVLYCTLWMYFIFNLSCFSSFIRKK